MDAFRQFLSEHRACMLQAKMLNHEKTGAKSNAADARTQFQNKNPAHRAASDDLTIMHRIVAAIGQLFSTSMRRAISEMFTKAPWNFILPACVFCIAWMGAQFMRGRATGHLIDVLFKSHELMSRDTTPRTTSLAAPSLKDLLTLPILFAFLEWMFNVLWDFFMLKAKTSLIVSGRTRYFRSLLAQPLEFHSGISSGELAARLISDSEAIDEAIVHAPCHVLRGMFTLLVAAYIISIDPWLFVLGLGLRLPWLLQFVEYAITVVSNYELLENNASNMAQAHANEVFSSIVTVQACTAEEEETHHLKSHLETVSRIAETGSVVACCLRNVENGLTLASEIVILAYGVSRVYNGQITFGVFMALKAHMEMFISQFNFFEKAYVAVKRASVQSARMFHFYDLHAASRQIPKDSNVKHDDTVAKSPKGCVLPLVAELPILEFSHVCFSYPQLNQLEKGDMPIVLSNVSFSVRRRSLTALLGSSGSGKSSIGKLILQFYQPASGAVYFNGSVCGDPGSSSRLRGSVSWVDQGCCLLNRSIKENLVMGLNTKPGDLQIDQACRVAQIYDHIQSLPEKYNTMCGQRGSSFSGGQQQRLVIARALLREPEMLLLDEATSALDAETEDAVVASLDRWRKESGATLLVITHRVRTVRNCDAAVILHHGKIKEFGTRDELMERKGDFYEEMKSIIPS